uniref:Phostensin/Taperin PP1-binding domain-containing protein n=1 Tax=Oryzias melastigma TaxID=30732 RepID=A0A3B3D8D5_ORYME
MSVSSLPEWKQLLLEKKRREEVERGRREKEEEEKLASMPAWKRGIIQRRRANDVSLSPDPGQWLDLEPKAASQVSVETIVPVHENPFMRTQSSWTGRKGKDGEPGNELEVKERDKMSPRGQDAETRRRFKDLNEGWERERSREGCEKDKKDIQIPRTVFYVAEEMLDKTKLDCDVQDWDAGRGVERTDSWRIGKSLSRIESLREKMRQKEMEKMKQGGRGEDGEEACDPEDRYWERGSETQEEQRRPTEADAQQEEASEPTSMTASDVRQEVCVLKSCPQLPVSLTQADTVEEVTGDCATTASEVISDSFQIPEQEEDSLQHVGDQLSHSEEEEEEYSSSFDSEQSLSPSPPHPNSLAAMSRIYNLETVGSRSGLCLRENISSSVHLVKVKPLVVSSPPADGVQLKEQEVLRSIEGKGLHSPKAGLKHQRKDDQEAKVPPRPQNKQTITIAPSFLRNQSSENSLKPANCAPTPASSPSSPSPTQSPCASPSPTPSPVLFSIKSASGGHVKRGATITVTPKKASTGGGAATRPTAPQQTNLAAADPARKKYPTVEEIEVIGGYQNLERSCLIKSRGTPKRVSSTVFKSSPSRISFHPENIPYKLPFVFVCFCMPAGVCSGC